MKGRLSAFKREEYLQRMSGERLDLLVIGGGITGAGIALDAASRGLRVGLVEKQDFAAGTSSRSTKLIHGGLRYLKQGEIALVFPGFGRGPKKKSWPMPASSKKNIGKPPNGFHDAPCKIFFHSGLGALLSCQSPDEGAFFFVMLGGNEQGRMKMVIFGHRGASGYAPENTLASFELALEQGCTGIELDVRQTRDGHVVVIHDIAVDRTTNGTGLVSQMDFAEIRRLDAGSWFDSRFRGEKVPALQEVLQLVPQNILLNIEMSLLQNDFFTIR